MLIALTFVVSSYGVPADDEKPASAASIPELKSGRSRRKLPTSMNIVVLCLFTIIHCILYVWFMCTCTVLLHIFNVTDYCIKHLYVLAQTSNDLFAGTIGDHRIALQANKQLKTIILPRPSGGLVRNKGDLWKLSLETDFGFTDCITVKQIENMALLENHNDGWHIDSIVTFLVVNPYYWALSSADFDVNRWVDKDGDPTSKQFILTLCV